MPKVMEKKKEEKPKKLKQKKQMYFKKCSKHYQDNQRVMA